MTLSVGTITVTVTDGTNPLPGIPVTLTGPHALVVIGTTDSSGVYSFTNIGAGGGYSVSTADGAATASAAGLSVTPGGTTPKTLILATGSIQATITEGGSPLPNAKVTVTGPNAYSVTQTAGAGGVVMFTGVGTGSGYTVTAFDGAGSAQQTNVSVSTGATTSVAIDIPTGSLLVSVDAGGAPIAGVSLTVTGPNSYSATGTTDPSGNYTFASLPIGTGYTVAATSAGSAVNQTGVNVTSSSTTHVVLALPTGSIRVSVQFAGNGLAGQTVTVTGPNSYSATGQTDSTGLLVLAAIPAGPGYTVSTSDGSTISQTGVFVTRGVRTDVLLTIPAGSLKVTVQNQSGTAIPGAALTLAATNGITAPPGTTGTDGTYTYSLPAATGYTVTANYGAASVASTSQAVTNGTTTNVTITIPTGSIAVTVKDQNGVAMNKASLTLTGPNSYSATGSTGAGNTYTFPNVPTNSTTGYTVTATHGSGSGTTPGDVVSATSPPTAAAETIPTGSIKGTVTAGGSNVGGAPVTVTYPGGFTASGTTATSGGGLGTVTIANVPAGSGYSVSATDSAGSGTTSGVAVTSGNTTSTTVPIPVGSLAVTVTLAGTKVGGATVTVTNTGGFSVSGTTATSGAGLGTVTLPNIPAGTGYTVTATNGGGNGTTTAVAVTAGTTTPASVALPTGSVAVTVKNQSSTALNGASLTLTGPGSFSASGSTGSGSTYTFTNVPISASGYTVAGTLGAGSGTTSGVIVSSASPATPAAVTIQTQDRSRRHRHDQGSERTRRRSWMTITYAGGFSVSGTTAGPAGTRSPCGNIPTERAATP